jgi:hypothetical protein
MTNKKSSYLCQTSGDTMRTIQKLPGNIHEEFLSFINNHDAREFGNSIRHLLLDFIQYEIDHGFRLEFGKLIWSLNDLLDLLYLVETEMKKQVDRPSIAAKNKRKL